MTTWTVSERRQSTPSQGNRAGRRVGGGSGVSSPAGLAHGVDGDDNALTLCRIDWRLEGLHPFKGTPFDGNIRAMKDTIQICQRCQDTFDG